MLKKRFSKIEPRSAERKPEEPSSSSASPKKELPPLALSPTSESSQKEMSTADLRINPAYLPNTPSIQKPSGNHPSSSIGTEQNIASTKSQSKPISLRRSQGRLRSSQHELNLEKARHRLRNAWFVLFLLIAIPIILVLSIRIRFLPLIIGIIPVIIILISQKNTR